MPNCAFKTQVIEALELVLIQLSPRNERFLNYKRRVVAAVKKRVKLRKNQLTYGWFNDPIRIAFDAYWAENEVIRYFTDYTHYIVECRDDNEDVRCSDLDDLAANAESFTPGRSESALNTELHVTKE